MNASVFKSLRKPKTTAFTFFLPQNILLLEFSLRKKGWPQSLPHPCTLCPGVLWPRSRTLCPPLVTLVSSCSPFAVVLSLCWCPALLFGRARTTCVLLLSSGHACEPCVLLWSSWCGRAGEPSVLLFSCPPARTVMIAVGVLWTLPSHSMTQPRKWGNVGRIEERVTMGQKHRI